MGFLQSVAHIAFGVNVLFLLLLGFSFLFLSPGSGTYVIATLTLVPILLTLAGSIAVIYTGWDPFE